MAKVFIFAGQLRALHAFPLQPQGDDDIAVAQGRFKPWKNLDTEAFDGGRQQRARRDHADVGNAEDAQGMDL